MKRLKTDYKDAMYDGQRQYRLVKNEDDTYGILDATTYTQVGDRFGENDINETNQAVNALMETKTITLTTQAGRGKGLIRRRWRLRACRIQMSQWQRK